MTAATALLQVPLIEDDLGDVAPDGNLLRRTSGPTELHHVIDRAKALAFLRRDGGYADAPQPDLILPDRNMPRPGGLAAS